MSDSRTQPTKTDEQKSLERIQRKVAAVNTESARAVSQSAGLVAVAHPDAKLANTHSALLNTFQELQRALTQTERAINSLESGYGGPTPSQIRSEHADRVKETYDRPVTFLALQLLELNERKWLREKPDTNGAKAVERHGLTENQRHHLNELQRAWRAYDDDIE